MAKSGSSFSSFLLGGLIGAGIALLTSRRTGEENRQMLMDRGQQVMDKANDYKDQAMNKATDYKDQAMNKASQYADRASQAVNQLTSKANQMVDQAAGRAHQVVNTTGRTAQDMSENIPNTGDSGQSHRSKGRKGDTSSMDTFDQNKDMPMTGGMHEGGEPHELDREDEIPNTGAQDGGITEWTHEASRDDSGDISDQEARREKNILEDDIDKTYDL